MSCIDTLGWKRGKQHSLTTQQTQKQKRIDTYNLDPKCCKWCDKSIPYEKKSTHQFCNHSCAAAFNNTGSKQTEMTKIKISLAIQRLTSCGEPKIILTTEARVAARKKINRPETLRGKGCKLYWSTCNVCGIVKAFSRPRKTCSEECKRIKISQTATNNPQMGGNKNRWTMWHESPIAGKVFLESKWELKIAQELDQHNVEWSRPNYLTWEDQMGKEKRYFADFYLPQFDLYLEPKNPYLVKKDQYKLNAVREKHGVQIIVLDAKDKLSWTYIKRLLIES